MKIKSKALLASFPSAGCCENCGIPCSSRERHHIFSKGAGGPDIRCNIIMLGDAFTDQCACHRLWHDGKIKREKFLDIVAKRERTTAAAIEDVINLVRRLPKNPSKARLYGEISNLPDASAILAMRELAEEL